MKGKDATEIIASFLVPQEQRVCSDKAVYQNSQTKVNGHKWGFVMAQ